MKPTQTSAATTAFTATKVYGPRVNHLWVDGNGKITAGNGTLDDPKPNAFSLVQIDDCPFSTAVCRKGCYVHGLQKHAPDTHALYRHNSRAIRAILGGRGDVDTWATIMGEFIAANCKGGFRWHVSGDIFNIDYARWIAAVCARSPNVGHWIYTRSYDLIGPLLDVATIYGGNLAINLSCDSENYANALKVVGMVDLRLCYMTTDGKVPEDLPDGSVIFPDYALRGGNKEGQDWFAGLTPQYKSFVCPVDYHGKSEQRRCGPCDRCLK